MMFQVVCVLSLSLLAYRIAAQAVDVSSTLYQEEGCSTRSLFNIVWGCIATTIICAWAAIHPNIPPHEGPLKGVLRRLELMFWTIVAPEILPCWALNQLLAAMAVRDAYNEGKGYKKEKYWTWKTVKKWVSLYEIKEPASDVWTLKHGHFLAMGGIHLIEPPEDLGAIEANKRAAITPSIPDTEKGPALNKTSEARSLEGRRTILTLEMLQKLVTAKDPEFQIRITEKDITDRSKGDALSKIVFISQSTWFIVQCLGRLGQRLGLTQLELTTLALASLNGITFILWWDKPLGAQAVVPVYLKRRLTDEERNLAGRGQSTRSQLLPSIKKLFDDPLTFVREETNIFVAGFIGFPWAVLVILASPIIAFALSFTYTIGDLLGRSASFPADATHVPTFYVPKHRHSEFFHFGLLIVLGSGFGAIHCAGWNLPFPTLSEQRLWHAASMAVTIIPIAAIPFYFVVASLQLIVSVILSRSDNSDSVGNLVLIMSMFAYATARLVLLGLSLAFLRHLPPTAFIAVNWTRFYPHIL